jgi:hypothetical protein
MDRNEILKILNGFREQVEKIIENKDFFNIFGFSLNYKQGKGVKIESRKIPKNTTKSFLIDFRPFWMNDSKYNFGKICNMICKETSNENIREDIKKAQNIWNKILEKKTKDTPFNGVLLIINNEILNSSDNLSRWMNGEYFHPDEKDKLNEIKSNLIFENMSYMNFIDQCQKMAQIIIWFNKKVVLKFLDLK